MPTCLLRLWLQDRFFCKPGQPILNDLGYYMHAGGHGAMPEDYPIFIKFMKMHFFGK
jgi:hypothetical protein